MKFAVINGSSRSGSQSLKVAMWLSIQLKNMNHEIEIIDLHTMQLPLVHEDIWDDIDTNEEAKSLRAILEDSDGLVIVTPEWNGMVSPALKNMFVYVKKTIAHKPAYLVAVSNSRGGAYPIAELRMTAGKNSFVNFIPEHLIVRGASNVLNSTSVDEGDKVDVYLKERAQYGLALLEQYSSALKIVRQSGVPDYDTYANGM